MQKKKIPYYPLKAPGVMNSGNKINRMQMYAHR